MSSVKYEPVPHCDSDVDLDDINDIEDPINTNNTGNKLLNLLKMTAHRRIIAKMTNSNNTNNDRTPYLSINMNDDGNNNDRKLDKNSDIDEDDDDDDDSKSDSDIDNSLFDDFVFLLFLNGTKKKVGIQKNWTIFQLKNEYFKEELNEHKNVRLIYRGQMLNDYKHLSDYNVPSDGFIHVSIAEHTNQTRTTQNKNMEDDINYDNFDDGMDDEAFARMLQQREMELNNGNNNFLNGNNNPSLFNNNNPSTSTTRNSRMEQRDFACGLLLGMMVGIWVFIFLLFIQRSYSRRFRLGIMLGVFINIIFQLSTTQQQLQQDGDDVDNVDNTANDDNVSSLDEQQQS